jgi:hypothetical protein
MAKRGFLILIGFIIIIIISIGIGIFLNTENQKGKSEIFDSEEGIISLCDGKSSEEICSCVSESLTNNYNFIIVEPDEPDYPYPKLEDLIENGGDCRSWALLSKGIFEELNFKAQIVTLEKSKYTGGDNHDILVAWVSEGKCILDANDNRIKSVWVDEYG